MAVLVAPHCCWPTARLPDRLPVCLPHSWVLVSELYPLRVRGKALGISSASNWIVNTGFSFATPALLNSETGLGTYGTFFLIASFLGLCVVFVLFAVPETKVGMRVCLPVSVRAWPLCCVL